MGAPKCTLMGAPRCTLMGAPRCTLMGAPAVSVMLHACIALCCRSSATTSGRMHKQQAVDYTPQCTHQGHVSV